MCKSSYRGGFAENAHFLTAEPIFTDAKEDADEFKPWLPAFRLATHPSLE